MKVVLTKIVENLHGSREAIFDLGDDSFLHLPIDRGDIEEEISKSLKRYEDSKQKTEVEVPAKLKDKEYYLPD